jgi:hypothetical protein
MSYSVRSTNHHLLPFIIPQSFPPSKWAQWVVLSSHQSPLSYISSYFTTKDQYKMTFSTMIL